MDATTIQSWARYCSYPDGPETWDSSAVSARRIRAEHRCLGGKSPRHIQIDQASVQFGDGRVVLPARADIQSEDDARANRRRRTRCIRKIGSICPHFRKQGTGIGHTQQKSGEVGSGGLPGKRERAARLLLPSELN
jgi:hypothetical protein